MKLRGLRKRIRYMARMVARSYLRGLSSSEAVLDRLLKQADEKEKYEVDELTRAYLKAWLARVAASDLKSALRTPGGTGCSTGSSRWSTTAPPGGPLTWPGP